MNRDRAKELLPIIQAFAEGKNVQTGGGNSWETLESYAFDAPTETYRIKPEPREFWLVKSGVSKGWDLYGFNDEEEALSFAQSRYTIKVREVIE